MKTSDRIVIRLSDDPHPYDTETRSKWNGRRGFIVEMPQGGSSALITLFNPPSDVTVQPFYLDLRHLQPDLVTIHEDPW